MTPQTMERLLRRSQANKPMTERQEASDQRIAQLIAKNRELRKCMDASLSFTVQIPSNVATHGNDNLPLTTFVVPSTGKFQSTMAFTPYCQLHPMASLASLVTPLTSTTVGIIPLGSTVHGSIAALPTLVINT
ncbi:hypothetical protein TIFTF001_017020 [Ficus carica]|uniref:Uncharacterized protein n=1 Tax=Ficus carica TaxID=3494 RepID=A0AA88AKI6_FICCA|nr:hypothetical protein TIFTF001_017020 [Ficus carica]